jgi:hypothetical protein
VPVVGVAVPIGVETQTRRSADLDESQRLREVGQGGQQGGAAGGDVGLGRLGAHDVLDVVGPARHRVVEVLPVAEWTTQVLDGGEQQIGLLLVRWESGEEGQGRRVGGDPLCDVGVDG